MCVILLLYAFSGVFLGFLSKYESILMKLQRNKHFDNLVITEIAELKSKPLKNTAALANTCNTAFMKNRLTVHKEYICLT